MNPKDKAKELVGKFYNEVKYMERAQVCALIAVDEILKSVGIVDWDDEKRLDFTNFFKYWEEVKTEIEKL